MNIQEILKKAKEHGAEAVRSALEELRQENQTITAEARAAYDAYFADVRQREAKIRQKVEALGQERDTLSEKILAMRPSLVAATVEGNTDMVATYISTIEDSQTRMIFRLRFIRGMSWKEVAATIGGRNTEAGVKAVCYRYIARGGSAKMGRPPTRREERDCKSTERNARITS